MQSDQLEFELVNPTFYSNNYFMHNIVNFNSNNRRNFEIQFFPSQEWTSKTVPSEINNYVLAFRQLNKYMLVFKQLIDF